MAALKIGWQERFSADTSLERGGIMMWGNNCWQGWGHGMGIGGMIMMLVFWILIIAGIVLLFRWIGMTKRTEFSGHQETPLDILKKRYAQGEVSKDEFERMKKDLEL